MPRISGIRRLFRFSVVRGARQQRRRRGDHLAPGGAHAEADRARSGSRRGARGRAARVRGHPRGAGRARGDRAPAGATPAARQLVERSSPGSQVRRPLAAACPALHPPRHRHARARHRRERRGLRRAEVGAARRAALCRRRSARARVRALARWLDGARTAERRDGRRSRLAAAIVRAPRSVRRQRLRCGLRRRVRFADHAPGLGRPGLLRHARRRARARTPVDA